MKKLLSMILIVAIAISLISCAAPARGDASSYLDLGQKYLLDGNYDRAIVALEKAIAIDPKNAEAYISLAEAHEASGDIVSAIGAYEDALRIDDSIASVYISLADCHLRQGREDDALDVLKSGYERTHDPAVQERINELQNDGSSDAEADDTEARAAEYINESKALLESGDLKQALTVLYDGAELLDSESLNAAINDYFSRVKIELTADPEYCDPEFCFVDTSYIHLLDEPIPYNVQHDYGLNLCDTETNTKQTLMRVTLTIADWMTPRDSDGQVYSNNKGHCFFYAVFGEGRASSFYYDISSNEFMILDSCLVRWTAFEDSLAAESMSFAAGDKRDLYIFDWNANVLIMKETYTVSIIDENIYYVPVERMDEHLWEVCRIDHKGKTEILLCAIEHTSGFIGIDGDTIRWTDDRKDHYMDLFDPYNFRLDDYERLINSLCSQIEDHYNELEKPNGRYVCFDRDFTETKTSYEFILRYAMSDEEADERIANGLSVAPNVYVAKITVDRKTGLVTDELDIDTWYARLR